MIISLILLVPVQALAKDGSEVSSIEDALTKLKEWFKDAYRALINMGMGGATVVIAFNALRIHNASDEQTIMRCRENIKNAIWALIALILIPLLITLGRDFIDRTAWRPGR